MATAKQLGFVMLGYEKSIAALKHLDFQSGTIQRLVSLMFLLDCDDVEMESDMEELRKDFAINRIKIMANRQEQYFELFSKEEYEFIMNAIFYFGNLD